MGWDGVGWDELGWVVLNPTRGRPWIEVGRVVLIAVLYAVLCAVPGCAMLCCATMLISSRPFPSPPPPPLPPSLGSLGASSSTFPSPQVGAGYGHWTFTAHRALSLYSGGRTFPSSRYLMIDVLDTLRDSIANLAHLNGMHDDQWDFQAGLIAVNEAEAAALRTKRAAEDGEKWQQNYFSSCWGLAKTTDATAGYQGAGPTTLPALMQRLNRPFPPCVDMIDFDIQGGEYTLLLNDEFVRDVLTTMAIRVHIGTHKDAALDGLIIRAFERNGWKVATHHAKSPSGGLVLTDYGPVSFGDGVLSLINLNPPPACHVTL